MQRILICALAACPALSAQQVHIVDASGNTGRFTQIQAAINAAASGDTIHIKKGVYTERLHVHDKALNILGIAPSPRDVVIAGTRWVNAFEIFQHPAGHRSRIGGFRITGTDHTRSIFIVDGAGDLIVDNIETSKPVFALRHQGQISLTQLRVLDGNMLFSAEHVARVFLHNCDFVSTKYSSGSILWSQPAVRFFGCHAELAHCRVVGPEGFPFANRSEPGGPGIEFSNSTGHISGRSTDTIIGGQGQTTGHLSAGGVGVRLYNSRVSWSGVTIRGGAGAPPGSASLGTNGSTFSVQSPAAPVVTIPQSYARDQVTKTTIHAAPGAMSLTLISLEWSPFQTSIGTYMASPATSLVRGVFAHDSSGRASFDLDLRGLPATFVSSPFVVQSFSLTNNALAVSTPRFGVVGH